MCFENVIINKVQPFFSYVFNLIAPCQDQGYSTDLLDSTQEESKNTIVKSNGLSRVLMLNLWIFSLEKNKSENTWLIKLNYLL